jgi:hypothetical protein
MGLLCELVSLGGVFQGLPGMLMPSLVVFFAVVRRCNEVCVRGNIVYLCGSIMFVFWRVVFSGPTSLILSL